MLCQLSYTHQGLSRERLQEKVYRAGRTTAMASARRGRIEGYGVGGAAVRRA